MDVNKGAVVSAPEYEFLVEEEAHCDLEGLCAVLDQLSAQGAVLNECTYVVNNWAFGGLIPLEHHGFIFKTSTNVYLTLDFGRHGIVWDVFSECPEFPDRTVLTKRFKIESNAALLKKYCLETEPFSLTGNDCEKWAEGLMRALNIVDGDDHGEIFGARWDGVVENVDLDVGSPKVVTDESIVCKFHQIFAGFRCTS